MAYRVLAILSIPRQAGSGGCSQLPRVPLQILRLNANRQTLSGFDIVITSGCLTSLLPGRRKRNPIVNVRLYNPAGYDFVIARAPLPAAGGCSDSIEAIS